MKILPFGSDFNLLARGGQSSIKSQKVAKIFGEEHDDILKLIQNLGCSEDFRSENFINSYSKDQHPIEVLECYMTRDGFEMLTMGFTGKEAKEIRDEYVKKLISMEDYSLSSNTIVADYE